MTERRSDFVIKAGYMVKRSQNKKRFTPVNYKTRWFELTRLYLSYYDIGNLEDLAREPLLTLVALLAGKLSVIALLTWVLPLAGILVPLLPPWILAPAWAKLSVNHENCDARHQECNQN
ncbi:hypothetical protein pipiens_009934 [Culex pipiens pipiens]|uniref:PH domain-containing protein n=1 Tax=Culex pipiens pipiens TaxID=38569 RepID=A0ABD1DC65_CULPP